jgi:hypothetical protein
VVQLTGQKHHKESMQHTRVIINMKNNTAMIYFNSQSDTSPTNMQESEELPPPRFVARRDTACPLRDNLVFIDDSFVVGKDRVLKERHNGFKKKNSDHDLMTKFFTLKSNVQ